MKTVSLLSVGGAAHLEARIAPQSGNNMAYTYLIVVIIAIASSVGYHTHSVTQCQVAFAATNRTAEKIKDICNK
jgi:hypothetical protein